MSMTARLAARRPDRTGPLRRSRRSIALALGLACLLTLPLLPAASATNFVLFDLDSQRWATNRVLRPDLRESREWLSAAGADVIARVCARQGVGIVFPARPE